MQSMYHNLIPPFIMREAGLKVEEQAKIHVKEPAKENHSIYSSEINLRIALQIEGIFQYPRQEISTMRKLRILGVMIYYI